MSPAFSHPHIDPDRLIALDAQCRARHGVPLLIPIPPGTPQPSFGDLAPVLDDECFCEFDYDEGDGEESWHYDRTCTACRERWGALHCRHEQPDPWLCSVCRRR